MSMNVALRVEMPDNGRRHRDAAEHIVKAVEAALRAVEADADSASVGFAVEEEQQVRGRPFLSDRPFVAWAGKGSTVTLTAYFHFDEGR
jgi:hypothetical protein